MAPILGFSCCFNIWMAQKSTKYTEIVRLLKKKNYRTIKTNAESAFALFWGKNANCCLEERQFKNNFLTSKTTHTSDVSVQVHVTMWFKQEVLQKYIKCLSNFLVWIVFHICNYLMNELSSKQLLAWVLHENFFLILQVKTLTSEVLPANTLKKKITSKSLTSKSRVCVLTRYNKLGAKNQRTFKEQRQML